MDDALVLFNLWMKRGFSTGKFEGLIVDDLPDG